MALRLNLGAGSHLIEGYENLDLPGWRWEDGLPFDDGSVEAATSSHTLMYVQLADWPAVFTELARVLEPGGIVRVTEDDTKNPESDRFGGWHDAITLTCTELVRKHMRAAGLKVTKRAAGETGFRDGSLLQAWHGASPKVFFLEGTKP